MYMHVFVHLNHIYKTRTKDIEDLIIFMHELLCLSYEIDFNRQYRKGWKKMLKFMQKMQ